MIGLRPMCDACIHLIPDPGDWKCKAFPEGLPESVASEGADHRKPLPGDNGIQFEQNPAAEPFDFSLLP